MDFRRVPGLDVYKNRASPLDSRIDSVRFTFVTSNFAPIDLIFLLTDNPWSYISHCSLQSSVYCVIVE